MSSPASDRKITGDPTQDAHLVRKVESLPREAHEQDPHASLDEAVSADVEHDEPRARRIALEDKVLSENPTQRRTQLLDYIRRGRLAREDADVLPDIIQCVPALLDSRLVDLNAKDYDEHQTTERLFATFDQIKQEVIKVDDVVRRQLATHGVQVDAKQYLTRSWYTEFLSLCAKFKQSMDTPQPKNPLVQAGKLDEYREDQSRRFVDSLSKKIQGMGVAFESDAEAIKNCALQYVDAPQSFEMEEELDTDQEKDPIKTFLYKKFAGKIHHYPTSSEYKGERISSPPDFSHLKVKRGIQVVDRTADPEKLKGFIFDGNFGFNAEGTLIQPEKVRIVDHHDALNVKQYDTATLMAQRFWDEYEGGKFKKAPWRERIQSLRDNGFVEKGESLITMVNDPDVDAILSVWAFRNPKRAKEYSTILNNISFCGDFLVGSKIMEYGANARDYNYIIMEYLKECEEEMVREKVLAVEMERATALSEQQEEKTASDGYKAKRTALKESDPSVQAKVQALDELNRKKVTPAEQGEKGRQIKALVGEIEKEIDALLGPEEVEASGVREKALKAKQDILVDIEKRLKELTKGKPKLSNTEKAKIVTHLLQITEDIITNPFKYDAFLQRGRAKELEGVQQAEELYRSGKVEILPHESDPDIIKIMPKEKMGIESIDGLYFFLRRRVDFNKRIVVQMEPGSYLVAVNTQNAAELKTYDFNTLIDVLRPREQEIIEEKVAETEGELAQLGEGSPKMKKELDEKLRGLRNAAQRNREGKQWRNRNQMAFSLKSYISESEFFQILDAWKKEHDVKAN